MAAVAASRQSAANHSVLRAKTVALDQPPPLRRFPPKKLILR